MSNDLPSLDHIYCINLETSSDRKAHMKKQFKKHNLRATFVSAVHPKTKEYSNHIKNLSRVDSGLDRRCFCLKECQHKKRKLRPSEIAISLSHYHVYRKMIRNNDYWALVCEDDVVFVKNFVNIINRSIPLEIWEDNTPHIIMCGGAVDNYGLKKNEVDRFRLVGMTSGCYSNYCYFVNFYAAQALLKHFFPIKRPEDSFKRHLIWRKKITCHRIQPAVVAELSAGRNLPPVYKRLSRFKVNSSLNDDLMAAKVEKVTAKIDPKKRTLRIFSNRSYNVNVEVKPHRKNPVGKIKGAATTNIAGSNMILKGVAKETKNITVKMDKNGNVKVDTGNQSLKEKIKKNNSMNLVLKRTVRKPTGGSKKKTTKKLKQNKSRNTLEKAKAKQK